MVTQFFPDNHRPPRRSVRRRNAWALSVSVCLLVIVFAVGFTAFNMFFGDGPTTDAEAMFPARTAPATTTDTNLVVEPTNPPEISVQGNVESDAETEAPAEAPAPTETAVDTTNDETAQPTSVDSEVTLTTEVPSAAPTATATPTSEPTKTASGPVAVPPPVTIVTVGDFQVTMPLQYREMEPPDGATFSQFEGPSGEVRVSSENLRAHGDLKSLSKDEKCIGDTTSKPIPLVLAEATQSTAMGTMKFARSTFTCPDQTYTYGYWNVEGVFAADVFYVGLHDGPFTDLTEAFTKATPID